MKLCPRCSIEKPLGDFSSNGYCTPCASAYVRQWRSRNAERDRLVHTAYRSRNRGRAYTATKTWRAKNPDKFRAGWMAANAKRSKRTRMCMPAWANGFFIEEFYDLARRRTVATGFGWAVDHVIPINGKDVCGLHVETNLAVIPASHNSRKGNKFSAVAE